MELNGFTCHYQWRGHLKSHQARGLYAGLRREQKSYMRVPGQFILSGPVIVTVWYHPDDAVALAKKLVGPTYADEAVLQDCIRGYLLKEYGTAQPPYYNAANFVHVPSNDEELLEQSLAVLGRVNTQRYIRPAA
jgi:nucleoside diphosphate kinase